MEYTKQIGGNAQAAEHYLETDLIEATSDLTRQLSKCDKSLTDFFTDYEECEIFKTAEPTKIHDLIVKLPTNSVITPNYDLLLEKAYKNAGENLTVIHKNEQEQMIKSIIGGEKLWLNL